MSTRINVMIHDVEADGLPDMDELTGQVAFIFDGCVVSGWPVKHGPAATEQLWEANGDVGRPVPAFAGVTHWIEFPVPVWELTGG